MAVYILKLPISYIYLGLWHGECLLNGTDLREAIFTALGHTIQRTKRRDILQRVIDVTETQVNHVKDPRCPSLMVGLYISILSLNTRYQCELFDSVELQASGKIPELDGYLGHILDVWNLKTTQG
ncbi:uncharacterized protein MCYG_02352 [Microsporum canis CBS 113480]|uniref:Uncharacterized protein n=1 Tax=Arthroderma otae (strain ATCC MYA-4605 / CBS 113480) TaxID=554155 RepID=C5FJB2_ARTOC|nr:uncharacterized protein MCYG_02352 [Microsporum canis CBS 113480]EEQ29533.1 predicted protein [Microsporum canis CBS 113480]